MLTDALRRRAEAATAVAAAPEVRGRVVKIGGLLIEATIPDVAMGEMIEIHRGDDPLLCEVVGFRDDRALAIPLGSVHGVSPGSLVRASWRANSIPVGSALLGRVIDPFGRSVDGRPELTCRDRARVDRPPPAVHSRAPVRQRFETGIRVIDGLLTCGRGQRVGVFAGAGVGKSVLVEQIALQAKADVVVVGLVGERGREVRAMMESMRRDSMVVVAATSDRSPMERVRGARVATSIAEHFRDEGADVLLIVDSVTRFAMALREIGLAIGEPPATKGYPPSVFAELPRLFERVAPLSSAGSITGVYTVLVEGDDLADPVADSARSLLDGHIVLSRDLASRGVFPAVDVLASASRVINDVCTAEAIAAARAARTALAQRRIVRDLESLGAYVPGTNQEHDRAMAIGARLDQWSLQGTHECADYDSAMADLFSLLGEESK